MKKKIIVILLTVFVVLAVAATVVFLFVNRSREYIFPVELIVGENCDDWNINDYKKYEMLMLKSWETDYCQKVYINDDGNIVVKFTEKQRKKAVGGLKDIFNDNMKYTLDAMLGFKLLSISDDYKTINVSFGKEYSEEAFDNVKTDVATMLVIQIYNGSDLKDASVTVNAEFVNADEMKTKEYNVYNIYE
ncbi:MAG: hypothetical protein IJV15_12635 [Lachnospiraceae bacterium]|nr:hypothetical protein [Lachnospiraceae bacterium]